MINNKSSFTQRDLANELHISLGTVNSQIREAIQKGLISTEGNHYELTEVGINEVASTLITEKETLLKPADNNKVTTAVILAAGKAQDFEMPACLLPINGETPIDRTISILNYVGISDIYVVLGYQANEVKAHLANQNIHFLENSQYEETGTMASLALIKNVVKQNTLVIDGDLVYERMIVEALMDSGFTDGIITTSIRGSGDEAFVDFDNQNNLIKISKDIRQMNRLSAEMIGISKISVSVLNRMFDIYEQNQNPWLNYEYLLQQVGTSFEVKCVLMSNAAWVDLDNQKELSKAKSYTLPLIKRNEMDNQIAYAKEQIVKALKIDSNSIKKVTFAGGMTNTNYEVEFDDKNYFIRIPGKWTEVMINRKNETKNAKTASDLGLNVKTIYINDQTGIKITESVHNGVTLSSRMVKISNNLADIAHTLNELHNADITFENSFIFLKEWKEYEDLVEEQNASFYPNYEQNKSNVLKLVDLLKNKYGLESQPCHNDLVAENFIRSSTGRLYLIDWEYSGMNDPFWDLAALCNESELNDTEEREFLVKYFGRNPKESEITKLQIFKVLQDILWSTWTVAKESAGEDFGDYGINRYKRGVSVMEGILENEK
ncbi:hypothetical protein IV88_GL000839 [Pediococcus argentinicus]|uniref:MobA-like NTP transferase domain-containing protein n=2 Tax=Pediococcus argentinicus TaxID=480391 RepID=A0A0R2NE05_9LACO|nr:hypothetical protein IV88_GL000839 [Pediococcus argentinicus]